MQIRILSSLKDLDNEYTFDDPSDDPFDDLVGNILSV